MIEAERIEVADRYHSAAPQDSSNARPRWSRALLAILLLATLVRLPSLIQHPFLQDELYTLEEATDLFRTRLEPGINARPLYFLLQHVLLRVLPPTEVGLRAPALLFGLLGLWATWLVARRLF